MSPFPRAKAAQIKTGMILLRVQDKALARFDRYQVQNLLRRPPTPLHLTFLKPTHAHRVLSASGPPAREPPAKKDPWTPRGTAGAAGATNRTQALFARHAAQSYVAGSHFLLEEQEDTEEEDEETVAILQKLAAQERGEVLTEEEEAMAQVLEELAGMVESRSLPEVGDGETLGAEGAGGIEEETGGAGGSEMRVEFEIPVAVEPAEDAAGDEELVEEITLETVRREVERRRQEAAVLRKERLRREMEQVRVFYEKDVRREAFVRLNNVGEHAESGDLRLVTEAVVRVFGGVVGSRKDCSGTKSQRQVCCNKVKHFPWNGSMNHGGREGGGEEREGGGVFHESWGRSMNGVSLLYSIAAGSSSGRGPRRCRG